MPQSSPRTWRCFFESELHCIATLDLLHARGGVSIKLNPLEGFKKSSPRTWRCFYAGTVGNTDTMIFSTHVEVFLWNHCSVISWSNLLHARGGVSTHVGLPFCLPTSSPRTWRCFSIFNIYNITKYIFSTHVEVFLTAGLMSRLCARSSPRTWRCFFQLLATGKFSKIFSTHVEVFLKVLKCDLCHILSSPRTWRCFQGNRGTCTSYCIFSTHVEVFLAFLLMCTSMRDLLHSRGGVSMQALKLP